MLGLRSRSRRRCTGSGLEDGDEVDRHQQRPRTRSRSGSRTDQSQGPRGQSAAGRHFFRDLRLQFLDSNPSGGNSGGETGEEEQVQRDGRGDDTAQDDSDVQIVEEDGVALSDSQEMNEVEEVAMGDADEVREEEVERDVSPSMSMNMRTRLENGVRRHERAELLSTVRSLEATLEERERAMSEVVGALTCPVCLELPRHLPVPVCQNGHTICLTCSRNGLGHCPVCRDPRPRGVSFLAGRLIQVVPHRCPYQPCNKVMTMGEVEEHQAACQHRNIRCVASSQCRANLTPAALKEHLSVSGRCMYTIVMNPRIDHARRKACLKFSIRLQAASLNNPGRRQFSLRAFQWEGRCFCVNIRKLVDWLLVLPMMVGSEEESETYAVRATLGGGERSVSFTGGVVSTEVEKRRWDEDGFLVSLKSIRKLLVPGTPDEECARLPCTIELESRQE